MPTVGSQVIIKETHLSCKEGVLGVRCCGLTVLMGVFLAGIPMLAVPGWLSSQEVVTGD